MGESKAFSTFWKPWYCLCCVRRKLAASVINLVYMLHLLPCMLIEGILCKYILVCWALVGWAACWSHRVPPKAQCFSWLKAAPSFWSGLTSLWLGNFNKMLGLFYQWYCWKVKKKARLTSKDGGGLVLIRQRAIYVSPWRAHGSYSWLGRFKSWRAVPWEPTCHLLPLSGDGKSDWHLKSVIASALSV